MGFGIKKRGNSRLQLDGGEGGQKREDGKLREGGRKLSDRDMRDQKKKGGFWEREKLGVRKERWKAKG